MTKPLAGRSRVLGRSLLTLANAITAVVPMAADWNDSHIFNRRWLGAAATIATAAAGWLTDRASAPVAAAPPGRRSLGGAGPIWHGPAR